MGRSNSKDKIHFTNFELLFLIFIIGLILFMIFNYLIPTFMVRVDQSADIDYKLTKAAEDYYSDHRELLPKAIGESVNISLHDLRISKYLKEDIYNSNEESCMNNSYVRVYHFNENEYSYLAYLYCGNDKVSEVENIPVPKIKLSFADEDGGIINPSNFLLVKNSSFLIDIQGGQSLGGTIIPIDFYYFTIQVESNSSDIVNTYSSGTLYTNQNDHLKFIKKISDFMNMEDATSITIMVRAQNVVGGVFEVTLSSDLID